MAADDVERAVFTRPCSAALPASPSTSAVASPGAAGRHSPNQKVLAERRTLEAARAATVGFRGGDRSLDETYVDFHTDVPFLTVLLEDEAGGVFRTGNRLT
jgi:hypothetical protein